MPDYWVHNENIIKLSSYQQDLVSVLSTSCKPGPIYKFHATSELFLNGSVYCMVEWDYVYGQEAPVL